MSHVKKYGIITGLVFSVFAISAFIDQITSIVAPKIIWPRHLSPSWIVTFVYFIFVLHLSLSESQRGKSAISIISAAGYIAFAIFLMWTLIAALK